MHTKTVRIEPLIVVSSDHRRWCLLLLTLFAFQRVIYAIENQSFENEKEHQNTLDRTTEKYNDAKQLTIGLQESGTKISVYSDVEVSSKTTFISDDKSLKTDSLQPQQKFADSLSHFEQGSTESIIVVQQKISQQMIDEQHPKRNYASKECGAKILYSNEEAENKAAILNDPERDDYMRNPCERAQNKFLIIELCETIQPNSLEIANFELFSSSPKDFRLWGSERYPTQEWALIGEFEAHDTREIQFFEIQQHPLYAKFIKLELLTHYGKEHFCTLSTFRLYGTSMVDEYEAAEAASATTSNLLDQQPAIAIQSNPKNKNIDTQMNNNETLLKQNYLNGGLYLSREMFYNKNSICRLCPQNPSMRQCSLFCHTFFSFKVKQKLVAQKTIKLKRAEKAHIDFMDKVLRRQTAKFCPLPSIPTACRQKNHELLIDRIVLQNGQEKQVEQQKMSQQSNGNIALNSNGNGNTGTGVKLQPQKPVIGDKGNIRPLPGTTATHKESVFMKLNKRLTLLEQNMSISSEQLTELIKRCANTTQTEDEMMVRQQNEQMMTKTAERVAKQESHRVELEMKQRVNELQKKLHRLSQQLQEVSSAAQSTAENNGIYFYQSFIKPVHRFVASDVAQQNQNCHENVCSNPNALKYYAQQALQHSSSPVFHARSIAINQKEIADEALWTTKQVICLVILTQVATIIIFKLYRVFFDHLNCFSRMVGKGLSASTMAPIPTTDSQIQRQPIRLNFNPN